MSQTSTGLSRQEKQAQAVARRAASGKPVTVTVDEACRKTGLGVTTIYALLKAGKIRGTRVGRRRLLFWDSLEQLLEEGSA
jgi:excisionase family DNA binding protein